jgi:hypothetical protein
MKETFLASWAQELRMTFHTAVAVYLSNWDGSDPRWKAARCLTTPKITAGTSRCRVKTVGARRSVNRATKHHWCQRCDHVPLPRGTLGCKHCTGTHPYSASTVFPAAYKTECLHTTRNSFLFVIDHAPACRFNRIGTQWTIKNALDIKSPPHNASNLSVLLPSSNSVLLFHVK